MSPNEVVMVVHVPVAERECLLIPEADLDVRERFAWWSRVWIGIFENAAWRAQAERLWATELLACASGAAPNAPDGVVREAIDAAAHLIVAFPQALEFAQVHSLLHSLACKLDGRGFEAMGRALRRANPVRRAVTEKTREAMNIVATARGRSLSTPLSVNRAIEEVTGERVVEGGRARAIRQNYEAWVALERIYPRANSVSRACGYHGGWLEECMPTDEAPRLVLTEREDLPSRRSFPILPLELMSGGTRPRSEPPQGGAR